jgi:hypothetical protein
LFEGQYYTRNAGRVYDVSADGKRFLMIKDIASTSTDTPMSQLIVVLNWLEQLKRLAKPKS